MKKTLLLIFIHGFMGNEDTFAGLPTHLAALLTHALPDLSVRTEIYPAYATRGALDAAASSLRDWLLEKVIDAEVALGTPSPTLDPHVQVVLVGHSMGGILAAEVALAIALESEVGLGDGAAARRHAGAADEATGLQGGALFPNVRGVLAFDTPFLGISPGLLSHGAEEKWATGKSWYEGASKIFGGSGSSSGSGSSTGKGNAGTALRAAPDPPTSVPSREAPSAAGSSRQATPAPSGPAWQRWAMVGAAVGAVAAAGAGAYLQRERLSSSWDFVSSHLAFVGCLARGEELKRRLAALALLERRRGVGFANLYTCLGAGVAPAAGRSPLAWSAGVLGAGAGAADDRTFCVLPRSALSRYFHRAVNDAAKAEADAHMFMFAPATNPGYYVLADRAKQLVVGWVQRQGEGDAEEQGPAGTVPTVGREL